MGLARLSDKVVDEANGAYLRTEAGQRAIRNIAGGASVF